MRRYEFETLDVFTDVRFGGNPLAVFPNAEGITDREMQSLAAELNLSETTFVLPPSDPAHTARVRIFNRTTEMPFAGHPTVGTGYVLATRGFGTAGPLILEVPAGVVNVKVLRDETGRPTGGTFTAPQPLTIGEEVAADTIAACLGLRHEDVQTSTHPPVIASVGNPYVIAELDLGALSKCTPDLAAFRLAAAARPSLNGRFSVHVYAWEGNRLRARMFAPLAGTWEDPATGSANAPLGALLLARGTAAQRRFEIRQGLEMGRPSLLIVEAKRTADSIIATVSGGCVPMLSGSIDLGEMGVA
ncbi:PhzF family phenazine biosynthesis protein [Sphingomonas sp. UYP23]